MLEAVYEGIYPCGRSYIILCNFCIFNKFKHFTYRYFLLRDGYRYFQILWTSYVVSIEELVTQFFGLFHLLLIGFFNYGIAFALIIGFISHIFFDIFTTRWKSNFISINKNFICFFKYAKQNKNKYK